MAILFKNFKTSFIELTPLILIFFLALSGKSIIDFNFFSVNIHYILIYYWVLRKPQRLGYGFIFLAGIINDVVLGVPIGSNALALLIIAAVAAYVRMVTVNVSLFTDWFSFIPALLVANFIYFAALYYTNYSIDYLNLLINSVFTFIFYPLLWLIFGLINNFMRSD